MAEASLSRAQLKFFAKATGQTNPIYFGQAAALKAGYPDIVAPPTWPALLDGLSYEGKLRSFAVRFAAMTKVHDVLTTSGEIIELLDIAGEPCAKIQLRVANQLGENKLVGDAVVAL